MDANAFRVVLQTATATVSLAIASVPLNAVSRQFMIDVLEDHVNRIYELADRINADFGNQEAELVVDVESSQSSGDVFEVAVSDQGINESDAQNGNEEDGKGESQNVSETGTVIDGNSPTRDEVIVNSESQVEPVAQRVNRFLFENYDDTDDEDNKKEPESDINIKQESPQYKMADLIGQGTDDKTECKSDNKVIEDEAVLVEELVVVSPVIARITTGTEQSKPSNPKRKREAADNSSEDNANDEASGEPEPARKKKSRVSGWTPINRACPPFDPGEESKAPTRLGTPTQEHHPEDPSIGVIDFGTAAEDISVLRRSSRSNRGRRRANSVENPGLRRMRDTELERMERERQERIRSVRQGSKE